MSISEHGEYVTVVPWYDRHIFSEICTASAHAAGTGDYDRWRGQAVRAIGLLLREGRAIEIVTVKPADYQAWLVLHAHVDSQTARQRFVCDLATA